MIQETIDTTLRSILDGLPDAIIWVRPVVAGDGSIEDFEVSYSNIPADEAIKHAKGSLQGLFIRKDGIPTLETGEANFRSFLNVYLSGKPSEHQFMVPKTGSHYETYRTPLNGGILSTTRDRRAQREAEQKEKEKAVLLNGIIGHAPVGIEVYEAVRDEKGAIVDFRIKLCNDIVHQLTGVPREQRMNYSFRELLHRLDAQEYYDRYVHTVLTGEPFSFEYYAHEVNGWLYLSTVKLGDGFMVMLSDIAELKRSQQELQHQTQYLNGILNTSLNAVVTMEAIRRDDNQVQDFRYRQVNDRFLQWVSKREEEVIGHCMSELFPGASKTGVFQVFEQVIHTGNTTRVEVHYNEDGIDAWFDLAVAPLDEHTAVGTFSDITESKESMTQLSRQKALLDNIMQHSSNGISVTKVIRNAEGKVVDGITILVNEGALRNTGLSREVYLSKTALEIDPDFLQTPYFALCMQTLETGVSQHTQYLIGSTGRWLEISISRMDSEHLITIFTDITSSKEAQLAIERSAVQLQTIINRTQSGIFTAVPVNNEEGTVVDFRFVIVNNALATYVQSTPEALAGSLGSEWFPAYKENGLFNAFLQTLLTGEPARFDFHYDAHGIDAWIDMLVTNMGSEILVTFSDYTPVKQLQLELQKLVEELKRSNASLEEFAYAASHDLQEPLRKIHYFSERIRSDLESSLGEEQLRMFNRMESATTRMRQLIGDLLAYSQVSAQPEAFEEVATGELVQQVVQDLEAVISQTGAVVTVGDLPTIHGDERQLRQMFQNLIGNALKYRKPDVPPQVSVTCRSGKDTEASLPENLKGDHYLVEVRDNGIGFDQSDADKIFQVFQRLHGRSEYEGTGVGLAIVQKVVTNHKGYIAAESKVGEGSVFRVWLPK